MNTLDYQFISLCINIVKLLVKDNINIIIIIFFFQSDSGIVKMNLEKNNKYITPKIEELYRQASKHFVCQQLKEANELYKQCIDKQKELIVQDNADIRHLSASLILVYLQLNEKLYPEIDCWEIAINLYNDLPNVTPEILVFWYIIIIYLLNIYYIFYTYLLFIYNNNYLTLLLIL